MSIRIVIGLLVFLLLVATHWKAYVYGKQVVKLDLIAAVRKAENSKAQLESNLLEEKIKVEKEYAKQKKKSDAVIRSTRNELDRLRDELRSYSERQNTASCSRVDADPRNTIIRECSEAAQSLARIADENGLKLSALQSYVTEVCLPR